MRIAYEVGNTLWLMGVLSRQSAEVSGNNAHWVVASARVYMTVEGFIRRSHSPRQGTSYPEIVDGMCPSGLLPCAAGHSSNLLSYGQASLVPKWANLFASIRSPREIDTEEADVVPLDYPGLGTPWEDVKPFLRRILEATDIKDIPWVPLEKLWDAFNCYVQRSLFQRERAEGTFLDHVPFHEKVAHEEADLLEAVARRVGPLHQQLRFLWRYIASFSWGQFCPMMDDIRCLSEMLQIPLSLDEVRSCWSALASLQREPADIGATNLSRRISELMPVVDKKGRWLQRVVALTYAKDRFRQAHGGMAALSVSLSEYELAEDPFPVKLCLSRLAESLLVSDSTLLEAVKIERCNLNRDLKERRPLPVTWLERLLNVLELAQPSWLAYCWYREDLDPHFVVECGSGGITLRSRIPLRSMSTYREVGLGGLCRATRFARRLSKDAIAVDSKFPCRRRKLIDIEQNRCPKHNHMGITRGLIRYFSLGASGALAVFPDIPRLIPTLDMAGRLLEEPMTYPYRLTGYTPKALPQHAHIKAGSDPESQSMQPGTLGYRLRYERALFGIHTGELARRMGRRREVIDRLESGRFHPSLAILKDLAWRSGFDVTLEEWTDLANKTVYGGVQPPSLEDFRARLPVFLGGWANHGKGDLAKLEMYRRYYQVGQTIPSQGELCFFLRKNLWRLELKPNLSLNHLELVHREHVDSHTFHDPEYNRRPLTPRELILYAQVYGVNPLLFVKAVRSTFPNGPDYGDALQELKRLAPRLFELSDQFPLTRGHFLVLEREKK